MLASTRLVPASSLQFCSRGLPKATISRARQSCIQLRAVNHNRSSEQAHQAEVISRAQLPKPRPGGWARSDELSTQSATPDNQASPVQTRVVKKLYNILKETLSGQTGNNDRQAAFRQQIRLAKKVHVFSIWPFPEQQGGHNTLVFQQSLSEFLFDAYHAEKLPVALPMLSHLLKALPACSTAQSPDALEFLERLAELYKSPGTPGAVSSQLKCMLRKWIPALQQVMADPTIRFEKAAVLSNAAIEQSQLLATTPTSTDSAAMQCFAATPHVERPGFFPQLKPYLWSPPAEHMAILRGDDLSPTAMDAYELVKSFVPAAIPEELKPTEVWQRHRDLLHKIGGGPHGPEAIQAYFKSKSNVFTFDFNARASQLRRMEKEHGQAVPPFNADNILSIGADVGFAVDSTQTDHAHDEDPEQYYL